MTKDIVPQVRLNLFSQIHQIVFFGKGGYDWNTVYNMPIWLRKYTFHRLKEFYENENKPTTTDNTAIGEDGMIKNPAIFNSKSNTKITPKSNNKGPAIYK